MFVPEPLRARQTGRDAGARAHLSVSTHGRRWLLSTSSSTIARVSRTPIDRVLTLNRETRTPWRSSACCSCMPTTRSRGAALANRAIVAHPDYPGWYHIARSPITITRWTTTRARCVRRSASTCRTCLGVRPGCHGSREARPGRRRHVRARYGRSRVAPPFADEEDSPINAPLEVERWSIARARWTAIARRWRQKLRSRAADETYGDSVLSRCAPSSVWPSTSSMTIAHAVALQQRPSQDDQGDGEIDHQPGHVDERRDERRRRCRRIEAEPLQEKRQQRSAERAPEHDADERDRHGDRDQQPVRP